MLAESPMRPSSPKASAASLPPPLLRLLPGGANQFPDGFNSRCGPPPFTAHPVCPLSACLSHLEEEPAKSGPTFSKTKCEKVGHPGNPCGRVVGVEGAPPAQNRRMRHPKSSQDLLSVPPAPTLSQTVRKDGPPPKPLSPRLPLVLHCSHEPIFLRPAPLHWKQRGNQQIQGGTH